MGKRHALYPGTFDPVTLGHLDILARALRLFDRVIVAVAADSKSSLFSLQERVELFRAAAREYSRCEVIPFSGLLVAERQRRGIQVIVRGIRSAGDYEQEWNLAGMNQAMDAEAEHVFLFARPQLAPISSSLVRVVARHGGDLSAFVVDEVAEALRRRYPGESS